MTKHKVYINTTKLDKDRWDDGELRSYKRKISIVVGDRRVGKTFKFSIKMDMSRFKNYSSLELKILNLLFNNINKVVTRNLLLDKIWEWTGNDVDDHTITVYLKRIREKINTDIIITVKGIGYRIDNEK